MSYLGQYPNNTRPDFQPARKVATQDSPKRISPKFLEVIPLKLVTGPTAVLLVTSRLVPYWNEISSRAPMNAEIFSLMRGRGEQAGVRNYGLGRLPLRHFRLFAESGTRKSTGTQSKG